ncbi:MAG: hypothetical protein JWM14_414 [Chitinophagaceae bacterium]|nr:hypothetical protein [Chitinophagaceae bacterium]
MKATSPPRIASLDVVRGLIMILMALDHARDFFHIDAFRFSPEDLHQSNLALFFTRWITHLCAPLFLLLAGISISLYQEKKSTAQTSSYVFFRGLWLVLLELTLIRFAWHFSIDTHYIMGAVIWVIGWSMVLMALFVYLPKKISGIIAILILVLHNTMDHVVFDQSITAQLIWSFLHVASKTIITDQFFVFILYPLLPALGVMLLGYFLGKWYRKDYDASKRFSYLLTTGIGCCLVFVLLRFTNSYGDIKQFYVQETIPQSIMSFFDVSKYPFSLHYCLATLGIGFVLLALTEKIQGKLSTLLATFGQVPMFYYILHLYFFHTLSVILFSLTNPDSHEQWMDLGHRTTIGYSLPVVYLIWLLSCILFFFLCKKYGAYKKTHRNIITQLI